MTASKANSGCGSTELPYKTRLENLRQSEDNVKKAKVLIVGSGPIGAVYARTLYDKGVKDILMIDMGAQHSRRVGDHHKNSVAVQKDLSLFTNVIKGQLSPLSVPVSRDQSPIPPGGWQPRKDKEDEALGKDFIHGNMNPKQKVRYNLGATAASRVVGGMSTHWTCCTPKQHPNERSKLFTGEEWDELYDHCEGLFSTDKAKEGFEASVRHRVVKTILEKKMPKRGVKTMPLACKQDIENPDYIEWSCTATILGSLAEPLQQEKEGDFRLMSQTQCDMVCIDEKSGKVEAAIIIDLVKNKEYVVEAERYVICAGTVLTAGIMAKSLDKCCLDPASFCPLLGKYMTEQTMTFCQIVLKQEHVDKLLKDPDYFDVEGKYKIGDKIRAHRVQHRSDPVPFPFWDFDPQVTLPYSDSHHWHTQIHRDAFGYGELPPGIDPRLVVDLRFFGHIEARKENQITWDFDIKDAFGMPQPTFLFELTPKDRSEAFKMMEDMTHVATLLGDFVPGAEPRHLAPGLALHICGIYRAGKEEHDEEKVVDEKASKKKASEKKARENSVVNREGKVWCVDNLYLGGCGIIPESNASNPTLTAACHALSSARKIAQDLGGDKEKGGKGGKVEELSKQLQDKTNLG